MCTAAVGALHCCGWFFVFCFWVFSFCVCLFFVPCCCWTSTNVVARKVMKKIGTMVASGSDGGSLSWFLVVRRVPHLRGGTVDARTSRLTVGTIV